jgi:hypothetical protein
MHANTIKANIRSNNRLSQTEELMMSLYFVKNDPEFMQRLKTNCARREKKNDLLKQALNIKKRFDRFDFLQQNGYYTF